MDLLRDMELFVEVAKAKNFSAAATVLNMPTTSLSRRIAQLEEKVGLRLLNRTTRRTELTDAGKIYYERCRHIVQEARLAHEQLHEIAGTPSGLLKVSMSVDFGVFFMVPILAAFLKRYPEIQLDLDLTSRNRDIMAEPVDVAIRMGELPSSSLYAKRITEKRVRLFASPDYLRQSAPLATPADLANHKCITMPSEYSKRSWKLKRNAEVMDVAVSNNISVNNMGMMLKLSVFGMGIAALGEEFSEKEVKSGLLVPVLPEWHFASTPVYAVTTSLLQPARIRVFIDFLAESFAES